MSAIDDDLDHAVEELCAELFSSQTASDALPLLRAASSLGASSRATQIRLGRALLDKQRGLASDRDDRRVVRFSLLAERFLYDRTTSEATMALLAVLAHGNLVNQRRIARHVPGMCITLSASSSSFYRGQSQQSRTLLVLTLPTALRVQYKQWRRRDQLLCGHRIPTGVPPAQDGVPAPCFCNNCLGSPQLLATWVDHFNDLTRWSQSDTAGSTQSASTKPYLSSRAFVQRVLESEYIHRSCPWVETPDQNTLASGVEVETTSAAIHFFVPTSVCGSVEGNSIACCRPDPTIHVCAIEIDRSIVPIVDNRQNLSQEKDPHHNPTTDTDDDTPDRVVLLEEVVQLQHCHPHVVETIPKEPTSWIWSSGISRFVDEVKAREEDSSFVHELLDFARSSDFLEEFERTVCCAIFEYLDATSVLHSVLELCLLSRGTESSQQAHKIEPVIDESLACVPEIEACNVRISAVISDQSLEILVRDIGGISFAGSIHASMLLEQCSSTPSWWAIPDESLRDLLQYCRLCRHQQEHIDSGSDSDRWICLTQVPETEIMTQSPTPNDEGIHAHTTEEHRSSKKDLPQPHARGLSQTAERLLTALKAALAIPHASVADTTNHLQRVIHECNTRMSALAVNAQLPAALCGAARERCRVCRDLLVQAGKRMKLGIEDDATGTLSKVAASRLQREIDRVLQLSGSSDSWEAPDKRVEQLHLSRRAWASGVPDPEFYINSNERSKANRVAQRHLNRRLLERARHR